MTAERPREFEPKPTVTECKSEEELVNFFTALQTLKRHLGGRPPDDAKTYPSERARSAQELVLQGKALAQHYYTITEGNGAIAATGALTILPDGWAILEDDVTARGRRGQALSRTITEHRLAIARRYECTRVKCYVAVDNPQGLITKMHSGFVVNEMLTLHEREACFHLEQDLEITKKTKEKKVEHAEVPLTSIAEIRLLLYERWIGVDLKNHGAKEDDDPIDWSMIFERAL